VLGATGVIRQFVPLSWPISVSWRLSGRVSEGADLLLLSKLYSKSGQKPNKFSNVSRKYLTRCRWCIVFLF
jgi:hypothetical protein